MRLLSSALLLAAASASAQDATITFTLSSANGGASTRFAWEIGGAWTNGGVTFYDSANGTVIGLNDIGMRVVGLESAPGMRYFIPSGGLMPANFADSLMATFSDLDLGLTLTNVNTGAFRSPSAISLEGFTSSGIQGLQLWLRIPGGQAGMLPVTNGQTVLVSGTTTGFIDIAQDFGVFNEGIWTSSADGFTQTLIIGSTPVPEPSTYGLILGALALAGAAVRRRRKTSK